MYEVTLERQAERDLRRLASDLFHRIIPVIRALGREPRPPGCRKLVGGKSDYRVRVGPYRVVYEIDDRAKVVRIMRVRHRSSAYRGS